MLEIGQVIDGKYKILNVIGKGGMSVVYLAMNERANKQWAIKEVRKDGMQDFDVVKQGLVAEIDMLKRFNHPNLPSIVDIIDSKDTFLIVMDYIEGNALDKRLKEEGAQRQEDVVEWAKQLCDVLGYLHSRKPPIIYRDMKPSNVMLKPDGTVMLIDFGTAREFKNTSVADTTCLGTKGYAAPEQFGGQGQTDPRTDIYCLGATMYHLVTNHNPSTYPYQMYPIRQWNSLLSSGLEAIILKCTKQNPSERYQSCAELMYALEHYQELDIESQKLRTLKWRVFLATTAFTLLTAMGACGFKAAEKTSTANAYEKYIIMAKQVYEDPNESYTYLEKAIALKPEEKEGYDLLLKKITEEKGIDSNEYAIFTRIVQENIGSFKAKSIDDYSFYCYEVGRNFLFAYDEPVDGAKLSQAWFDEVDMSRIEKGAINAGRNDHPEMYAMKIENLNQMATFIRNGGIINNTTGDAEYTYRDYWDDYVDLINSNIESNENVKQALDIYKRFAITVYSSADFFVKEVGAETIKEEFNDVSMRLDHVSDYGSTYREEYHAQTVEEIRGLIDSALAQVNNAKNQKRQEKD